MDDEDGCMPVIDKLSNLKKIKVTVKIGKDDFTEIAKKFHG